MSVGPELYLTYVVACAVVVMVPGPTVTVIIANSLAYGAGAGLRAVAGAQLGQAVMLAVLVLGLASIIETMGLWFDWVRIAGALYLVWLGWKLLRAPGTLGEVPRAARTARSFVVQGFVVTLSNPKALLFFGAFIPQFIDPGGAYLADTVLLGVTFMAVAALGDGGYALVAGNARRFLSAGRLGLVNRAGGLFLIAGGVWLAAMRR